VTHCGNVIGPVWKLDGESWACELPEGHDGDHEADGTWWADEVGKPKIVRA
jgi:hypothetical protein